MSKYIKYNECVVKINEQEVFALSADLNAESSLSEKQSIEQDGVNYRANSSLNATLNLTYYVTGQEDQISMLTGDSSCSGSFGGINFSGAYLTSYNIDIEPYVPVVFNASFSLFSGYDENLVSPDSFSGKALDLANGAHTQTNNINLINVGIDYPVSINYSVGCQRIPSYKIGSEFPCEVRYGKVEKSLSIDGEGIGSFINFSGKNIASINVTPTSMNGLRKGDVIQCEGVIHSQNLSISKGDIMDGSISIKERVR